MTQTLVTMLRWWTKQLGARAFIIFQRLQRFNQTFIVLAALVAGLDIGALSFPEFRPPEAPGVIDIHDSSLNRAAQGLFCTSAVTAVVSALTSGMLLFQFEGLEKATRLDLAVAWMPLTLMDVAIVEFLIGITCWYSANNVWWRGVVVATHLASLMGFCIALSVYMWVSLKAQGGLGEAERQATATATARRRVGSNDEGYLNGPDRWLGKIRTNSMVQPQQH